MHQRLKQLARRTQGNLGKAHFCAHKILDVVRHDGAGPGGNGDFDNEVVAFILEVGADVS